MPVPIDESKINLPSTAQRSFENHSSSPVTDPPSSCYASYDRGVMQDAHASQHETMCYLHVYPGAMFSIRRQDGTYENITGPTKVPMYTTNGVIPIIASPSNYMQHVYEENGIKQIVFVPNGAPGTMEPPNPYITPVGVHQHPSPPVPLPNIPLGAEYFNPTMVPSCQSEVSPPFFVQQQSLYQNEHVKPEGNCSWSRNSEPSVTNSAYPTSSSLASLYSARNELVITNSGVDVQEEQPISYSSKKNSPSGRQLKNNPFRSPNRSPSPSFPLPLTDESEEKRRFMKRFATGSKALSVPVTNELFGSSYGRWSSADMSDSAMNPVFHTSSHFIPQSTSGGGLGEWRQGNNEQCPSSDSLPETSSSMRSSSSPGSSLTSSPRLSPRSTHNGHKGRKSPMRGSPRGRMPRQNVQYYPAAKQDFLARSSNAHVVTSSVSFEKVRHVIDPDQSSDYSTASEYRPFECIEDFLKTVKKPEVTSVETRKATVTWCALSLENFPPEVQESLQAQLVQFNLFLARFQSKKNSERRFELKYRGPSFSHELKDLKPGSDYSVKICAVCDKVTGHFSEMTTFRTVSCAPDVPSAPKLHQRNKNFLLLKWTAPTDNGEKIEKYHLEYDESENRTQFQSVHRAVGKQCRITNLVPSRAYVFRLSAENKLGRSDWSPEIVYYTSGVVPSVPESPVLLSSSPSSLVLSWSKHPDVQDVTSYVLEMDDESKGYGFRVVYNGSDLKYTAKNLQRSYIYKFRLQAVNSTGSSNFSKVAAFSTCSNKPHPPGKPKLKGNIHARAIALQWDPTIDDGGSEIQSYKLYMSAAEKDPMREVYTGIDREFMVSNLEPGHIYRFYTTCTNRTGRSNPSEEAEFKTNPVLPGKCPCPSLAMKPKSSCVTIKWGPPSTNGGSEIINYEVNYSTIDAPNNFRDGYTGSSSECTIFNLLPGSKYSLGVRAANRVGFGSWSDRLEVTTCAGCPEKPEILEASARSSSCINIRWKAPVENGAPITSYKLRWGSTQDSMSGHVIKSPHLSHELTSLTPHTLYYFTVQATNSAGISNPSDVVSASTFAGIPGRVLNLHPALPPISEHDIDDELASAVTSSHVTVMWDVPRDNGSKILEYKIQVRPNSTRRPSDSSAPPSENYVVEGTINYFKVNNLIADTEYKFKVCASNMIGTGPTSSTLLVRTNPLPPKAPVLTCSNKSYNSLKLEWTADNSTLGTQYHLQLRDQKGRFMTIYRGPNTSFRLSRLTENMAHKLRINAVNSAGPGPFSDECLFETDVQPPPAVDVPIVREICANECKVKWAKLNRMRGDAIVYRIKLDKYGSSNQSTELESDTTNCLISSLLPDTKYRLRVSAIRLHPYPHDDSSNDPDHFQTIREVLGTPSSVVVFQTLDGTTVPSGSPILTSLSDPIPVAEKIISEKVAAEPGENLEKVTLSKTDSLTATNIVSQDSYNAIRIITCYLVSAIFLAYVLAYFYI